MASPAAQKYFNSFPPGQQAVIQASWGGADLMDQWFQNAVNAGAVGPDGSRPTSEGATSPTGSTGGFTAAQLRQLAQQGGWSEDFARFNDATLQGWINDYWDPQAQKFRSMRGAEGFWEKPTECPPGMSPGGPNETDPCIGPGGQQAPKQATGGAGGAGVQGGYGTGLWSPLQDLLANQGGYLGGLDPTRNDNIAGIRGGVVGGGGIWYQPTGSITAPKKEISSPTGPRVGSAPVGGFLSGPVEPGRDSGFQTPRSGAPVPGFSSPTGTRDAFGTPRAGVATPGFQSSALASALTPYQAPQNGQQPSGLAGLMAPWQQQKRKTGSTWF